MLPKTLHINGTTVKLITSGIWCLLTSRHDQFWNPLFFLHWLTVNFTWRGRNGNLRAKTHRNSFFFLLQYLFTHYRDGKTKKTPYIYIWLYKHFNESSSYSRTAAFYRALNQIWRVREDCRNTRNSWQKPDRFRGFSVYSKAWQKLTNVFLDFKHKIEGHRTGRKWKNPFVIQNLRPQHYNRSDKSVHNSI